MRERPILFSGEMVRALLREENPKTQTRRVCRPAYDPDSWAASVHPDGSGTGWIAWWPVPVSAEDTVRRYPGAEGFKSPYGVPGDRLWVREAWAPHALDTGDPPQRIVMKADGSNWWCHDPIERGRPQDDWPDWTVDRWRPSIHMFRWMSRITLEVIGVRVERVQDTSEDSAELEGCSATYGLVSGPMEPEEHDGVSAKQEFADLWDSVNAKRGFGWDVNPWVWVVEFKRIPDNA